MVTARSDSYAAASGGGVFAGIAPPPVSERTALIGDSLTTHLVGYNWSPIFWANGLNGGPLQIVANAGISGDTVGDMLTRVDNAYTNATPGLAGLGTLGRIIYRGGTNNARADTAWPSISATVASLLAKLKGYCDGKVVILSVPPVGPSESNYAAINARTLEYNIEYAALAAADPTRLVFVNDSANLRDGGGAQLSGYFNADGIHNSGRATWKEGVDAAALLASELAGYSSPLSTDAADVYPAQPQWNANHVNAGTGGTVGTGFTGSIADGYSIAANGSSITGTVSIVVADGGDPNAVPWVRVTPTQVTRTGAGESIRIGRTLSGRSITTSDPSALDFMVELRFNSFDTNWFNVFRLWLQGGTSGLNLTADLDLKMGGEIITHSSVVLRHAMPRPSANTESSLTLYWDCLISANNTGSMGSFDFRCLTIRG